MNNSTWLDKTLDTGSGDHVFPVSYFRSTPGNDRYISATPTFAYTGTTESDWKLRGVNAKSPEVYTGTFSAGTGQITGVTTSDEIVTLTIQSDELEIDWEISRDNGATWIDAGTTKNHLFVTGADTSSYTNMFETVIYLGCEGAKGKRPANPTETAATKGTTLWNDGVASKRDVVNGVWARFGTATGTANPKTVSNETLTYWGDHSNQDQVVLADFTTVPGLLKNHDGRCGAWAAFLVTTLQAQGVQAKSTAIVPSWGDIASLPVDTALDVSAVRKSGSLTVTSDAAQGNASPWRHFSDHDVVTVTDILGIYDPSYGKAFTAGSTKAEINSAWATASLVGFQYVNVIPSALSPGDLQVSGDASKIVSFGGNMDQLSFGW